MRFDGTSCPQQFYVVILPVIMLITGVLPVIMLITGVGRKLVNDFEYSSNKIQSYVYEVVIFVADM